MRNPFQRPTGGPDVRPQCPASAERPMTPPPDADPQLLKLLIQLRVDIAELRGMVAATQGV